MFGFFGIQENAVFLAAIFYCFNAQKNLECTKFSIRLMMFDSTLLAYEVFSPFSITNCLFATFRFSPPNFFPGYD